MKKIYVVIDTNVLLSSLLTKKKDVATVKIIELAYKKKILPVVHKKIIAEYEEVLNRKEFKLSKEIVKGIVGAFSNNGIFLDGLPADDIVKDPKDVVFYEVALDAKTRFNKAYLVTGNIKDFPAKPIVVTPAELIKIIEG